MNAYKYSISASQNLFFRVIFISFVCCILLYWWSVRALLTVTEVYIDGTDEWIEITNIDENPFIGSFTLEGAKSTPLFFSWITIEGGESFVLWDQCLMFTDSLLCHLNQGLSLTDTKWLNLILSTTPSEWNSSQSTISFSSELVNSVNDKKTSLSCLLPECQIYLPTENTQTTNSIPGYVANPWVVFSAPPIEISPPVILDIPPQLTLTNSGTTLNIFLQIHNSHCEQNCLFMLTGNNTYLLPVQVLSGQIWSTSVTETWNGQREQTFIYSLFSSSWLFLSWQYVATFTSLPPTPETRSGQVNPPATWTEIITWENSSWDQTPLPPIINPSPSPTPINEISPSIFISEIHPTHDLFPEYIELFVATPFSGKITIQGGGNGSATKIIYFQNTTPQRILITSTPIVWIDYQYILPGLSLNDWGEELSLLRQSGQQIDKAVYTNAKKGFSYYRWVWSWLDNNFTRIWPSTPWVSEELFSLFTSSPQSLSGPTQCEILLQHTTPLYVHNKINLQAKVDTKPLTSNSLYSCHWSLSWSEFTWCNPSFLSFEKPWIYPISLTVFDTLKSKSICTTTTTLNLPTLPKTESCRADYYSGLYTDRKEKYGVLSTAIRSYGFHISGSWTHITLTSATQKESKQNIITGEIVSWYLTILQLIPNPIGKDQWNERIEIQTTTGSILSWSLQLSNGNNIKSFPPQNLLPSTRYSFTWNWWLLNKTACITLAWSWVIYDTYCYKTPKEWVISERVVWSTLPQSSLSWIILKFVGDTVCAKYKWQTIVCKDLIITKTELKKWSKQSKTLQKKLTTALQRHDKLKKLTTQFTTYKKQQQWIISTLKNHYSRAKSTLYTLKNHLKASRIIAYQDPYVSTLYNLFSLLDDETNTPKEFYGKDIYIQDISVIQKISLGTTVYDDAYIPTLIEYLVTIMQWYEDKATPKWQFLPP